MRSPSQLECGLWKSLIEFTSSFFKDRFLCSLHKDISSYQLLRRFSSFIVTKDWDVYGGWYIKIYVCLTLYTGSVDLDLDFQNCFITFFLSPDVLNLINSENDTNSKFRIGKWSVSMAPISAVP